MGYFSNLAAQYVPNDHDHSYTPPEKLWLWRLEDLENRLHELTTQRTGMRDEGEYFSEDNLRDEMRIADVRQWEVADAAISLERSENFTLRSSISPTRKGGFS